MPYVAAGGWIAPGFQSQYGQEVHVVAFICMSTSSSPLTRISHPFRWITILRLPYAPTRCPSTDFPNSPTCSSLSLYCCHYHCLFSPPLPFPCKESWLPFQALPLRSHSHVSSLSIHFSLASCCNTRQSHKKKRYYTQALPPSPANTSTYRLLTFFLWELELFGLAGGSDPAPAKFLVPIGVGGAESSPGGARFDLTRIKGLPAGGGGGEAVTSAALPGLPNLCPFNDVVDDDDDDEGGGGVSKVDVLLSYPTDLPGDAVCARGGGGGGGVVFGASPSAYKSSTSSL